MKKYLVICVDEEGNVCSVFPCDTTDEAASILENDAKETYDEVEDSDDSSLDITPSRAKVSDGEAFWKWSIYPIEI